jgi:transcriptional regulator
VGKAVDVVQGTLDVLILKVIAAGPVHGWAIAQKIRLLSDDVLQVQQGSLYPALQRIERRGWITAEWGASDNNRRARYYRLTKAGAKHLAREEEDWQRMSGAVSLVLRRAGA